MHGRYDRVCHLYQAEALVRALRSASNSAVNYFITTAGHTSFEPETDARLRMIMDELPPLTPPETTSFLDQKDGLPHLRRLFLASVCSKCPVLPAGYRPLASRAQRRRWGTAATGQR